MKNLSILLVVFICVCTSCSYESGVSDAMAEYRFKDGVTSITVPGWVIGIAANFGDLEESERELLESIDKVSVITIEDDDLNASSNFHEEFYAKINRDKEYEELLT